MEPKQPVRVIADRGKHQLVTDFYERACYDRTQGGYFYLFRKHNDREAIARWEGWLRSKGDYE